MKKVVLYVATVKLMTLLGCTFSGPPAMPPDSAPLFVICDRALCLEKDVTGSPDARVIYMLSKAYVCRNDIDKAHELLLTAADLGYKRARFVVACAHLASGTACSREAAFEELKALGEEGYYTAADYLASAFDYGRPPAILKNSRLAKFWRLRASSMLNIDSEEREKEAALLDSCEKGTGPSVAAPNLLVLTTRGALPNCLREQLGTTQTSPDDGQADESDPCDAFGEEGSAEGQQSEEVPGIVYDAVN